MIATSWRIFRKLDIKTIKGQMRGDIIIDPFKVLDQYMIEKYKFKYYCLG